MTTSSYVVISPARNEEDYIERTIRCMVSQTVQPLEWIIVDDGSSDRTVGFVEPFTKEHSWIRLVRRPDRGSRQRGPGVVSAFYDGYTCLEHEHYDFIVKLDVDLSFDAIYFEELLRRFEAFPSLGIAGGALYIFRNNAWILDKAPLDNVLGPTKVYRRTCFDEIGGLTPALGWDAIDDLKAQVLGWETRTFRDLVVLHYRAIGKRSGALRAGMQHGKGAYFMGGHPLYVLARGIYRMGRDRPLVLAGLGILLGYFGSYVRGEPQVDDSAVVALLRRKQLRRINPVRRREH